MLSQKDTPFFSKCSSGALKSVVSLTNLFQTMGLFFSFIHFLKVHGILIILLWLELADFKIRRHNLNRWANPLFYFASLVYEYRYLLKYFDCLSSDKLRKIFVQDKKLEEYTPAGEVGWVSQINTVKSSAIVLQIRARLTFKTSASRSLHDSLNSFF